MTIMLQRSSIVRAAPIALLALSLTAQSSAAVIVAHPNTRSHAAVRLLPNGSKPVNWPQLGFDSGHTAFNPNETTISPSNVGQLQQAWSFSTGSGNTAGNVVYVDGVVYAASAKGTVFAIDAQTGSQLWSFDAGTGHQSSGSAPAVDKGLVFTVCNLTSSTQGLCALDASTGIVKWSYAPIGSTSYAGTPPVFSNGSVYFEACTTSSSCSYVALDETQGTVHWSVSEGSCESANGVTLSVANGYLYTPTGGCGHAAGICAVNVTDGTQAFCGEETLYQIEGMSVGKKLGFAMSFTGLTEELVKFEARSRASEGVYTGWDTSMAFTSMPALAKGVVVVQTFGANIAAFKAKHRPPGKQLWYVGGGYSSPSVANGVVFTACPGHPCATQLSTGFILWYNGGGASNSGVPTVVNGVVYGACNGSQVCAYTLPGLRRRFR